MDTVGHLFYLSPPPLVPASARATGFFLALATTVLLDLRTGFASLL